jgi:lipoyl(octanoyl) transferase
MHPICNVHRMGLLGYEQGWQLQGKMAAEIGAGRRPASLLLLEHPHTYTFGRGGKIENLLWDEAELARRGIRVHWVDRGGDVTYHGPGQLVGYPLLRLNSEPLQVSGGSGRLPKSDYVGYLRQLEEVLIKALAQLGVVSIQVEGLTGVWVHNPKQSSKNNHSHYLGDKEMALAKIAAIGIKVDSRGVTRHGFALNVNPEMSYWEGIIACGLVGHPVVSLAELLDTVPTMESVMDAVVSAFGETLEYEMVEEEL